jgi:predicted nucleic acid-binding protein
LRENLSAYDAMYVALAETLDTVVLTCDAPLSRAPGLARRIELILADA